MKNLILSSADLYKNFISLEKHQPNAIVTLPVETYNVLMTWEN